MIQEDDEQPSRSFLSALHAKNDTTLALLAINLASQQKITKLHFSSQVRKQFKLLAVPFKPLETFSIRFFMGNCKPQTAKCHVTTALRSRLQFAFTFEPREGLPAVSDLRQGFFATKNCTASRLKVWTSFLYPFAMCLLDF